MSRGIDRRGFALGSGALAAGIGVGPAFGESSDTAVGSNVLRILFESAETGFDPAQTSDLYSTRVDCHIFETLLGYDPIAIPVRLVPLTAEAMPSVADDFKLWTLRVRPGIFFADDPAFQGKRRELVAEDYVFTYKRVFDPALKSPLYSGLLDEGIVGLDEVRQRALANKTPFDYRVEVEGLRTLDRYTIQFKLKAARPRFTSTLANDHFGAIAREVVEAYGGDIMAHPVGTGPYRLKSWRRSSRIVLEKNSGYRDVRYSAEPAADDAQGQAWAKRFNGRRLPLNDGVEVQIVEENQPRWLSFLNGDADFARVPPELSIIAAPNGKIAPNLAKQGIELIRYLNPDSAISYFNMEDPVVGGYAPERVALRRAVSLAYDIDKEIRIIRRGQAIPAQAPMPPGCFGYDPNFRTVNSEFNVAKANGLLDTYGYLDRDGDGWRERPDGSPLVIAMGTQPEQVYRQYNENWLTGMAKIGLRMRFDTMQFSECLKAARAGKLQMWFLGSTASDPDGQGALARMYSGSIGQDNLARFKLPAFDAIYRRMLGMPDTPERAELFKQASELTVAYMPYRVHVHRIYNDFSRPWITGYRQPLFREAVWQYIEVDGAARAKALG